MCACRLVTEFLERQESDPARRRRLVELAGLGKWGAKEWLEHFALEDDRLLPRLRPKARATIFAQHEAFRKIFAQGRTPSRAALLAHAMFEERAIQEAGLAAA